MAVMHLDMCIVYLNILTINGYGEPLSDLSLLQIHIPHKKTSLIEK